MRRAAILLVLLGGCDDGGGEAAAGGIADGALLADGRAADGAPADGAPADGAPADAAAGDRGVNADGAPQRDVELSDGAPDPDGAGLADALADAVPDAALADAAADALADAAPPDPCLAALVRVGAVEVFAYEASRPDADAASSGAASSRACSRPGVLPWVSVTRADARAACVASGFSLCAADAWQRICQGEPPEPRDFPYGFAHNPAACNDHVSGAGVLEPTGARPRCVTPAGVFDLSGNAWELVEDGEEIQRRGGSYKLVAGNHHVRDADCRAAYFVSEPFFAEDLGFRCCRPSP